MNPLRRRDEPVDQLLRPLEGRMHTAIQQLYAIAVLDYSDLSGYRKKNRKNDRHRRYGIAKCSRPAV